MNSAHAEDTVHFRSHLPPFFVRTNLKLRDFPKEVFGSFIMTIVGEVSDIPVEFAVQWKIPDFISLSTKEDECFVSPLFLFANSSWTLQIFPNGVTKFPVMDGRVIESIGYIGIYLVKISSGSPIRTNFFLGIKSVEDKINPEFEFTYNFRKKHAYGNARLLNRSKLLAMRSKLMPSGVLTVICKIKHSKSTNITSAGSLSQDFKKVLSEGLNHDLILKVGDKELRAHQDILRARSQVFKSMLSHDMMEKNSGIIDIPDCDPEVMEQFLSYIYSGKVDILEQSMLKLYYTADKYDVKGLKEECEAVIKDSLSFTNICDVIQLALNHSDSSLLECATEYFMDNVLDIMNTAEWQSFMEDNSAVANELTIKSIKKLKNVET